jgi:hypothetical protein
MSAMRDARTTRLAMRGRLGSRCADDSALSTRQKDCRDRARPLNRREAFRAVWRERWWGSDADADKAEQRFSKRLAAYRAGLRATPAKWQVPGTCLAEVLNAPAVRGRPARG